MKFKKLTLIEDWRKEIKRLWSIRIALGLAALSGLQSVWPAFADAIPHWAFAVIAMALAMVIIGARLIKQKEPKSSGRTKGEARSRRSHR